MKNLILILLLLVGVSACSINSTDRNLQIDSQTQAITDLQQKNADLNNEIQSLQTEMNSVKIQLSTSTQAEVIKGVIKEVVKNEPVANEALKACPLAVSGLKFDYPGNWGACRVSGDKIYFRTDFKKYQVDLVISFTKITQKKFTDLRSSALNILKLANSDGEFYSVAQSGGGGYLRVGKNYYQYSLNIEGNQAAPANLNGLWERENNITPDTVTNIIKTARQ